MKADPSKDQAGSIRARLGDREFIVSHGLARPDVAIYSLNSVRRKTFRDIRIVKGLILRQVALDRDQRRQLRLLFKRRILSIFPSGGKCISPAGLRAHVYWTQRVYIDIRVCSH